MLDHLTGLANRAYFVERLADALARDADALAVFCIDLDRFKLVNDSLGYDAGDRLLVEVARRLRDTLPAGDTVARLGEDEFTILCEDCPDAAAARVIAGRLNDVLSEPVRLEGRSVFTSGSIGVLLPGGGSTSAEEVMRDADAAMHAAKRRGKARYEVFDAGMRESAMERLELEADLRRALETDELVPYFQPIVDTDTGEIRAVETLVRWQHPERGLVPPNDFLPICEEIGLMVPLGRRLLREACAQVQRWREGSASTSSLSVNLSVSELGQPDLIEAVTAALADAGAEPNTLCLEITEHALMTEASHCLENLAALDELGVRLALDDFGTGYSSLAYLRRLADRHPQDRPRVHDRRRTGARRRRRHRGDHRPCPRARAADRGRGDRDRGAVGRAQAARLRVRAGLPVQPPAARRRARRTARRTAPLAEPPVPIGLGP